MSRSTSVTTTPRIQPHHARRYAGLAVVFTTSAALSACLNFSPFGCQDDSECDSEAAGRCEAVGYCSYPDSACETGYSFEPNAGDGLGGECVTLGGSGTDLSSTGNDDVDDLDTNDESSGSTTGDPPATSSETGDETTTGPACGGAGDECCAGGTCDDGLACNEGLCGCVTAVSVGDRHSCATKLDGSLWCWGANDLGQIASGLPEGSTTPIEIPGFGPGAEALAVSASNHTCTIRTGDIASCWGNNGNNQVDFGAAIPFITTPTDATWAAPALRIGAGGAHTCVARSGLPVICWGDNTSGQLSGKGMPGRNNATLPMGFEPSAIALGNSHSCVSALTGELLCWGNNASGQLGLDPAVTPSTATPNLITITPIGDVVAGANHTCARAGAEVLCWGANDQGQVGNGTQSNVSTPTAVTFPPGTPAITSVVAGADQTCAITANGELYCWGGNQNDELLLPTDKMGIDAFSLTPVLIDLDFDVAQFATGLTHSCALSTGGQAFCWGENDDGELGDGTTTDAGAPTPVSISCP